MNQYSVLMIIKMVMQGTKYFYPINDFRNLHISILMRYAHKGIFPSSAEDQDSQAFLYMPPLLCHIVPFNNLL